jgi:hypothetical protein
MTAFIVLTEKGTGGRKIALNVAHIASVCPQSPSGGTVIDVLGMGRPLYAKEHISFVLTGCLVAVGNDPELSREDVVAEFGEPPPEPVTEPA